MKQINNHLQKLILAIVILFFLQFNSHCQSYIPQTLNYDGQTREYQIYVPSTYDGSTSFPLIFNFHGGSGDIASQIYLSDMSSLAETENFLAVYPQALADPNDGNSTNWIHKDPTNVDDVFFVDALINEISSNYNVDLNRVYACGYSLGGEFTFEVGCRLNSRIASIGVVARTMQTYTFNNCSPSHPTGVLTILGTDDAISLYNGVFWQGTQYYLSADEVHTYWSSFNNCSSQPVITQLPNTNTSDGSTVERHVWSDANGCSYVEHLKVIGGGHDWPGTIGNMDINSTNEIWNFVSRFDLNGEIGCNSTGINISEENENISVYPNPFNSELNIQADDFSSYVLHSIDGKQVQSGNLVPGLTTFNFGTLSPTFYILEVGNQTIKLIKQ